MTPEQLKPDELLDEISGAINSSGDASLRLDELIDYTRRLTINQHNIRRERIIPAILHGLLRWIYEWESQEYRDEQLPEPKPKGEKVDPSLFDTGIHDPPKLPGHDQQTKPVCTWSGDTAALLRNLRQQPDRSRFWRLACEVRRNPEKHADAAADGIVELLKTIERMERI